MTLDKAASMTCTAIIIQYNLPPPFNNEVFRSLFDQWQLFHLLLYQEKKQKQKQTKVNIRYNTNEKNKTMTQQTCANSTSCHTKY